METNYYITPTHMLAYCYCPRFIYYNYVLKIPERQEKRFKVQKGRETHDSKQRMNQSYLRKKLGVVKKEQDVELNCLDFHVRGKVDELLYLEDGTMASLDYKYAEYKEKTWKTFKVQETLYSLMISKIYKVEVKKAFLCFIRSKSKIVEIELRLKDFELVSKLIEECLDIIQKGLYPAGTKVKERCNDCTYQNICLQ